MGRRCLQSESTGAMAADLDLDVRTIQHWLKAFNAGGLSAWEDAPRLGRPPTATGKGDGVVRLAKSGTLV